MKTKLTGSQFNIDEDPEREEMKYAIQFEQLAHDQLKMIAQAKMTGDPTLIQMSTQHLEDILPTESRFNIQDLREFYIVTETKWVTKHRPLTSDPKSPLIINKCSEIDYNPSFTGTRYDLKEGGDVDNPDDYIATTELGGAHWLSPIIRAETTTDYDKWLALMVDELQNINAAWRQVRKSRVQSRIPKQDKPTPYHEPRAPPMDQDSGVALVVDEDTEPDNSP